jgi:chromosome segregation ATPase
MYGDTGVMRRRAAQLREQGDDIRLRADRLVAQMDALAWSGRAAEAMRERIRERASHLRDVAGRHDGAADSLERHLHEVESLKEQIATTQRRAESLTADTKEHLARLAAHDDPDGVRRTATEEDRVLTVFTPPPSGHKDWLTVELPGL